VGLVRSALIDDGTREQTAGYVSVGPRYTLIVLHPADTLVPMTIARPNAVVDFSFARITFNDYRPRAGDLPTHSYTATTKVEPGSGIQTSGRCLGQIACYHRDTMSIGKRSALAILSVALVSCSRTGIPSGAPASGNRASASPSSASKRPTISEKPRGPTSTPAPEISREQAACLKRCERRNMYTDCADKDGNMMSCPCHCP
jgi:hypothetical protein